MKNKVCWKPGGRSRAYAGVPMISCNKDRKRKEERRRSQKGGKAA